MSCTFVPSLVSLNAAPLAEAAQAYAQMGIAVFPLIPCQKEPLVPGGFYSATTDPQLIASWWSQWPHANIGIATGEPNGWCVLDVDPRHQGLTSLEAMERDVLACGASTPVSATLWQMTGGGGLHLIYQLPRWTIALNIGRFANYPGIDVKKSGGYVVGAPSIHPNGSVYEWQRDVPPAPFPPALLALLKKQRQRVFSSARACAPTAVQPSRKEGRHAGLDRERDPAYWLNAALRHARPGKRHDYALFLAFKLVEEVGCSFAEAQRWMHDYVARVIQVPRAYELEDALRCLDSAWSTCVGS